MWTRIDHIMICVRDLDAAIAAYRDRLGFHVYPGGVHPGRGSENAIAFFQQDYLELLSVRDAGEARTGNPGLLDFLGQGEGLRYFIMATGDIDAEVAAMRARGADVEDVREGARATPDGTTLRWRYASLGPGTALPFFLIQHLTSEAERVAQVPQRAPHPNGAVGLAAVVVPVDDLPAAQARYERALGQSGRPADDDLLECATVRFRFGTAELALAPDGALRALAPPSVRAPCLAVLESRDLRQTRSWLSAHGVPAADSDYVIAGPEWCHGVALAWIER